MNYGYKEPVVLPEDYHFGSGQIIAPVLRADGQWDAFLPEDEFQSRPGIETYACTAFGTLHALATLIYRIWPEEGRPNWSERFTAIVGGVDPDQGGGDPNKVAQAIHTLGLIPQLMLPFDEMIKSVADFYLPKPMQEKYLIIARRFLEKWDIKHDWVITNATPESQKAALLMDALKYSTIGASVHAWHLDPTTGYYIRTGGDTHWVEIYGFEVGKYWKVFDSYDNTHKKLAWNHLPGFAKRYSVQKKSATTQKDWFTVLVEYIRNLFTPTPITPQPVTPAATVPVPPKVPAKYDWSTPEAARHSFRIICDEEGISLENKNLLCQVLRCESGFKIHTVHKNSDARQTTDFGVADEDTEKIGIAQFNNYWYKNLISPEDALNNPEKACRLFISQFKKGHLKDWVCYSSGMYKSYQP